MSLKGINTFFEWFGRGCQNYAILKCISKRDFKVSARRDICGIYRNKLVITRKGDEVYGTLILYGHTVSWRILPLSTINQNFVAWLQRSQYPLLFGNNIIFCLIHNSHFSIFTKLTLLTILDITYDTDLWISFLWRKRWIVCLDAYSELSRQSKMIYIENQVGSRLDVGFCSLKRAESNAFNNGESWEILHSKILTNNKFGEQKKCIRIFLKISCEDKLSFPKSWFFI